MSRSQHLAFLAMVLITMCLALIFGHAFRMLSFLTPVLWLSLWLSMRFRSRRAYISISEEGIRFVDIFQGARNYTWSQLEGEPKLVKRGLALTIEQEDLRSPALFMPLNPLSKQDREGVFALIKTYMRRNASNSREAFRCLRCGNLIGTDDEVCSACGWTWAQGENSTRVQVPTYWL